MFKTVTAGVAGALILAALTIVVVGFALVPFVGIAFMSAFAAAETAIDVAQVPSAPAQVPGPAPAPPPSSRGGVMQGAWHVESYDNGQGGMTSVLPDVQLTATFGDDGSVSGNAGCNGYRGPYTIDGQRITFGSIVSTRRACLSQPLTEQETRFLAALNASGTYDLAGDRLTLRDAAGTTRVVLVRQSI